MNGKGTQSTVKKQKEIDASVAVNPKAAQPTATEGGKKIWKTSELNAILKKNPRAFEDDKFEAELDAARKKEIEAQKAKENFEKAYSEFFKIVKETKIKGSLRTLYLMQRK